MGSYADLYTELVGQLPGLSVFLAKRFVTRALRDICNSGRQWSFQFGESSIVPPAVIGVGTVGITTGSAVVTCDATAAAALNALPTPPVITFRQIRFAGTTVYNIAAFTAPGGPLTLDRPVADPTNAASAYSCYQAYYPAPVSDFERWITVVDPINDYDLELDHTRQELDYYDPGRQSTNQPVWVVSYRQGSLTGGLGSVVAPLVPYYELWPHPTTSGQLLTTWQRIGTGLLTNPADVLPTIISDELLIAMALGYHGYPWAMANAGRFPELKGVNWGYLITESKKTVKGDPEIPHSHGLLNDAKRMDDETFNRSRIFKRPRRRRGWPGPIDSNFFQTHGVPSGGT